MMGMRFFSNSHAFFNIQVNNKPLGRVTFELFSDDVPKTSKNFLELCKGHEDGGKVHGYKGSHFHRIIPSFMCQGGDFVNGDGTGSYSIYGAKFPDENFKHRHDQPGLLSMANSGPNTNGSQFFLTTVETPWLDGAHVVFGRVTDGLETLKKMELEGTQSGQPRATVTISDCGELKEEN
jgi:peptidylprolyl isomerase